MNLRKKKNRNKFRRDMAAEICKKYIKANRDTKKIFELRQHNTHFRNKFPIFN